ncbi:MAG TPA: polymer-forming cytoskeletal protein [Rhizomicrobium sp.]
MFALSRRSDARFAPARSSAELPPSFLGSGIRVRGVLEIEGELTIQGFVAGRIAALKLIIAPGGRVEGDIVAREVVVSGNLNGRIFAPNVTVEETAHIDGRIFHNTITVARGAHFDGRMPWRPVNFFETLDQLPETQP